MMNERTTPVEAIDISELSFGYDRHSPLLHIDHWQVTRGEHLFLYGPSGSGKSTLLNLLSGILSPQQGKIDLLGQAFSRLSARKRDAFRAQHIGVVFQEFNLIPFLTVLENIALAGHFAKKSAQTDLETRAETIFSRLRLDSQFLHVRADRLSVGQRQRVSIARALINSPELLIADEPTSALDSDNRDEFMQLLLDTANASDSTVIFVSHDKTLQSHFDHTQDVRDFLSSDAEVQHAV